MKKFKLKAIRTANKKAGRKYAALVAEKNNLDDTAEKVIGLFVQSLADDLTILNCEPDDLYFVGLDLRLNKLCSDFSTKQEKIVREVCKDATAEAVWAYFAQNAK